MPKKRGEQTPVNRVQLRVWYENEGLSQLQIAERMDVRPSTVTRWFRRFGIAPRNKSEAAVRQWDRASPAIGREKLNQLYTVEGLTMGQVAERLGVPKCRIEMLMRRYNIPRRRSTYTPYAESRYEILVNEDEVVSDYEVKMLSVKALSRKYGMCDIWISKLLKRRGIKTRGSNHHKVRCSKVA